MGFIVWLSCIGSESESENEIWTVDLIEVVVLLKPMRWELWKETLSYKSELLYSLFQLAPFESAVLLLHGLCHGD